MGEYDSELALNGIKQWHEEDKGSEFYIIEEAGHCANMDNADKFNEVLKKFLIAS